MTSWTVSVRRVAAASVAGSLVALACDALLLLVLAAAQVRGGVVWWAGVRLTERSAWMAAAGLVWLGAGIVAAQLQETIPAPPAAALGSRAALRLVGLVMVGWPVVWLVATWVVLAVRLTAGGGWPYEGRVFLDSYYYSSALTSNAPTILGGLVLLAVARHWRE
jgi:hypothetical protein